MHRLLMSIMLLVGTPALADPTVSMPEVSHGSNPHRSIVGAFQDESGTRDLLVIPSGQDFIITAYYESGGDLEILRDDVTILSEPPFYRNYVEEGLARLRVEGGATLRVRRTDSWGQSPYYIQGFLTQGGAPDRFICGRTPGGGTHPVWTSESERDFIARTILITTSWCNFEMDGTPVSFGSFPFDQTDNTALSKGRGAFVIPAGSTLSLTHGMAGEACTYFIEGAYVQP